jgi:hypothetical protein
VEDMLQTYKDEVDTLNEALKIAAMDIAEVAEAEDDYFISDEEEDEEEEDASQDVSREEDALSVSAASESVSYASAHTQEGAGVANSSLGRTSKETLYREALKDSSTAGSKTAAATVAQQKTFVIKEDGTFEKK